MKVLERVSDRLLELLVPHVVAKADGCPHGICIGGGYWRGACGPGGQGTEWCEGGAGCASDYGDCSHLASCHCVM